MSGAENVRLASFITADLCNTLEWDGVERRTRDAPLLFCSHVFEHLVSWNCVNE